MRAGSLDRTITIQSFAASVDALGTPTPAWTTYATVRAQLIQGSAEEFLRGYGETDSLNVIFRTRYLTGITTKHRVQYEGKNLNIREVKELGRRRGLELRCEEVRT